MIPVLMQSAAMGGDLTQKLTQRMADLYINREVSEYSILDPDNIEWIAEQGDRSAQEQISH